jgi:quinol monooxygenase YgiN
MAIRLVVSFKAQPGKGAEMAQAFLPRTLETQKEPGCEQYEIFRSEQDPDNLVLLERWSDQAALDAHMVVLRSRTGPSPLAALGAGAPVMERYQAD